ncbi:hypothetical protein BpHYR1_036697 [Brachionus plicatilis]|uniref:Uncharacterized protein n=1 Tax=Brachionus plicatilis TaxID=10195 RepID=A0A3M7QT96_BRAPC|nr:hypothetical protein BpHYR1_036697 [Brachionus plicatilis]
MRASPILKDPSPVSQTCLLFHWYTLERQTQYKFGRSKPPCRYQMECQILHQSNYLFRTDKGFDLLKYLVMLLHITLTGHAGSGARKFVSYG